MRYIINDKKYHFRSAFDTETGAYMRTGILDEEGNDTGVDPFMASYPHLIDVGIMGHCIHGKTGLCAKAGIGCYQSGLTVEQPNMTVEDFQSVAEQSKGKCNQFALGGRGDPDQHEHFEEILKICRENLLVPNFTTSGYGMTPEIASLCKKYCGAVAVSWYRSEYTVKAIQMLLDAGVKTNIHYVLGKNSIDEAIYRMSRNDFPAGINAAIFLLHKPAGQGTKEKEIVFPDSLKTVSGFTFGHSDIPCRIKKLTFSEGPEVIVSDSFNYLDELEEVTLPDSVKTVGNHSFSKLHGDRVRISASKNTVFEEHISTSIFGPAVAYRD